VNLDPGVGFVFRRYPRWQLWRRGFGAAQVVSQEPSSSVVHLRVLGTDGSVITHLPILESMVLSRVHKWVGGESPDLHASLAAVARWRREHAEGNAGVFSVPLPEAVDCILATVRSEARSGPAQIESAYPLRDADGVFRTVCVVVLEASQQRVGADGRRQA
jgi:hypothetical protein